MYCALFDAGAPVVSASAASTYADADILWTGGTMFPGAGVNAAHPNSHNWDFDVKSMRKIRTRLSCDVVATNNCVNSVEVSGVIRALIRLGGN